MFVFFLFVSALAQFSLCSQHSLSLINSFTIQLSEQELSELNGNMQRCGALSQQRQDRRLILNWNVTNL